ncbi:hypothetical protein DH2020_049327 [Rehmannia glutinosa]|uniref:Protein kinase domain-containing protein n=1 Tax=Rehmannia glutinosa TaxID=99300 RepID=A0ABR0U3X1_REHGL
MSPSTRSCFLILSILSACLIIPTSSDNNDDESYAKSLLNFKQSLTNPTILDNWKLPLNTALCSWNGILCVNGSFVGLRLENMGLSGRIDIDSLSELPLLSLSLMNNNFSGQFPSDISKLTKLRSLFLANNSFSGDIPDGAFSGMKAMRKVVIGYNLFTGKIPMSLLGLPKLVDLEMQDNEFRGRIPDFWQVDLVVNFANNKLEGNNLCGKPLDPCKPNQPIKKIAFIIAAVVGVALALFIILLILYKKRSKPLQYEKPVENSPNPENPNPKNKGIITYKNSEHGKLHFVRNDRERFELEELLRASAEVLGSGSFGSSYKAVLLSGQPYVVRRFRQMSNVGKEDFYEHMRRLGRLSHRNLLPLVGKRNPNQPGLDWPTRLRIIKGVARGLSHLYNELPTLTLPHGHLKSSNVLLDKNYEPSLSDYALSPLINKDHAQQFMVAYKSPESTQNDRVMKKTDVWSLGILILELLTGKFPANYLKRGRGPSADLATWVNSVVREEWTGEVFDKDMSLARNGEGQMLRLLKIGMCCCEWNVEKRWDLREAVERIEELKERDGDDDFSSNYASEGDVYSSRGMTDDDFSFSRA